MTFVDLTALTSPEAAALAGRAIGSVPIGALEQHGPHLPLSTDSVITTALVRAACERVAEPVVVAPCLPVGLSAQHASFAGTVTLSAELLVGIVEAYLDSFERMGIRRVALMSAHGGNLPVLASRDFSRVGRLQVAAYTDFHRFLEILANAAREEGVSAPACDSHAGAGETSLILHLLGSSAVRHVDAGTGYQGNDPDWFATLSRGIEQLTPDGVVGDPTQASSQAGCASFAALAAEWGSWLVGTFGLTEVAPTVMAG